MARERDFPTTALTVQLSPNPTLESIATVVVRSFFSEHGGGSPDVQLMMENWSVDPTMRQKRSVLIPTSDRGTFKNHQFDLPTQNDFYNVAVRVALLCRDIFEAERDQLYEAMDARNRGYMYNLGQRDQRIQELTERLRPYEEEEAAAQERRREELASAEHELALKTIHAKIAALSRPFEQPEDKQLAEDEAQAVRRQQRAVEIAEERHQGELAKHKLQRALDESRIQGLAEPAQARHRRAQRHAEREAQQARDRSWLLDEYARKAEREIKRAEKKHGPESEVVDHIKNVWDERLQQLAQDGGDE